jgi:hypothetical protein
MTLGVGLAVGGSVYSGPSLEALAKLALLSAPLLARLRLRSARAALLLPSSSSGFAGVGANSKCSPSASGTGMALSCACTRAAEMKDKRRDEGRECAEAPPAEVAGDGVRLGDHQLGCGLLSSWSESSSVEPRPSVQSGGASPTAPS